jgi:hypothetical protein
MTYTKAEISGGLTGVTSTECGVRAREPIRQRIAADVEAYLANGGQIDTVPGIERAFDAGDIHAANRLHAELRINRKKRKRAAADHTWRSGHGE